MNQCKRFFDILERQLLLSITPYNNGYHFYYFAIRWVALISHDTDGFKCLVASSMRMVNALAEAQNQSLTLDRTSDIRVLRQYLA